MKVWVCTCFDTSFDFCEQKYNVRYDSFDIEIIRGSSEEGHNLFIETTKKNAKLANEATRRFLSEICWLYQSRVEIIAGGGWASHKTPTNVAFRKFARIGGGIDLTSYRQIASTHEQKIALGIYREAFSSNSIFYKFLSCFKIINMIYKTGKEQKDWINNNIEKLIKSKSKIEQLKQEGITNLGEHFYHSGRCAIAHSNIISGEPIADADNHEDNFRIGREIEVIKELAEIIMSDELMIPTRGQLIKYY
ncbi:methylamine utilization protein MauJ [Paenibacillus sp. FSL H7-0703]|jgi:hypothetical protein